jgi:hypothetical protein
MPAQHETTGEEVIGDPPLRDRPQRSSSSRRNVGNMAGGWMPEKYFWRSQGEVFFT